MVIRKIIKSDDVFLAAIIRKALEEFKANKPGTVYFDKSTDHLSEVFTTKNSAYFVAVIDNEIAGGAGFYPTEGLPEDTCELVKMYLSKDFRGKAIGQTLLQKSMEEARLAGYKKMYIETLPELTSAIPLYKKNGFQFLSAPMGNSGHTGCDVWMLREI
jgi:putative acetyltransferase